MDSYKLIQGLIKESHTKICLMVIDGLGGSGSESELDLAIKPNLDSLCRKSDIGLFYPLGCGITVGSGVAHLLLFGYPHEPVPGRGLLEALGINIDVVAGDVLARGNFATLNGDGVIVDRRAGRISTQLCSLLCERLKDISVDGATFNVFPVKEHRAVVRIRGENLSEDISDTDTQKENTKPLAPRALSEGANLTAEYVSGFLSQVNERLKDQSKANTILLRGFSKYIKLESFSQRYKLNAAAIATYPMYRGIARLLSFSVLDCQDSIKAEVDTLKKYFQDYDFFYIHIKEMDKAGEDGDIKRKVEIIEEVDNYIPEVLDLHPDVLCICGDHCTPANLRSHSWHPTPLLIYSPYTRPTAESFSEKTCAAGSIGHIQAQQLMTLLLAHAGRLKKYYP